MILPRLALAGCALALVSQPLHAAKNAPLPPVLAKQGKVVVEENFSAALATPWQVAKGDWQAKDGVLTGKEKASDKHAGVLLLAKPNRNSIVQFSFKLDGVKAFDLSLNSAAGHLFRVTVDGAGIAVNKDKDKKDAKSKAVPLGKAEIPFPAGQWFTMRVEIKGDQVSVQTDNGAKIQGSAPGLDVDKTGYRFVARHESISIADLKIWKAE